MDAVFRSHPDITTMLNVLYPYPLRIRTSQAFENDYLEHAALPPVYNGRGDQVVRGNEWQMLMSCG
jgi:hypothetical protein